MRCLTLLIFVAMAHVGVFAETTGHGLPTLTFGGAEYLHRWSKNGQNEFTPKKDGDLSQWHDMVTINVHPSVRTGDDLAKVANQVLGNYQSAGKIISTGSKARTAQQPAEHFIAAVLESPAFLEAAFARCRIHDGTGVVIVYSHRIYGKSGPEMRRWLEANGEKIEKTLMAWNQLPSVESLRKLPQGK